MARRGEIPSKPPMEEAIAAAEATLEALVKAAEDFAVPLIAEQRAGRETGEAGCHTREAQKIIPKRGTTFTRNFTVRPSASARERSSP